MTENKETKFKGKFKRYTYIFQINYVIIVI